MKKLYRCTGLEPQSPETNAIEVRVTFDKLHGYVMRVRAVERDNKNGCTGYMYSKEYYDWYYDEVCLLESCKRKGVKAEERANKKAREIVGEIVDKYIARVAALSGVEPQIISEEEWR